MKTLLKYLSIVILVFGIINYILVGLDMFTIPSLYIKPMLWFGGLGITLHILLNSCNPTRRTNK